MLKLIQKENPTIAIFAGEASGDLHGSLLMSELLARKKGLKFVGMGGFEMRGKGLEAIAKSEELSVMGGIEVLGKIFKIIGMLKRIKKEIITTKPDAIILIDAPDFNFRIAKMGHALNIPIFYYISPKLWAWRQSRVKFIKKYITRLISILPFEQRFYKDFDIEISYVGHPLLDIVRTPELLKIEPIANRIGILPGSRKKEISSLLPIFGEAAKKMLEQRPDLEFVLPLASGFKSEDILKFWPKSVPIKIEKTENRYALMRSCTAIIAASGTVTLETALLEIPTIVAYRLAPISFLIAKKIIKVPYISLPNLILRIGVFPEFLQNEVNVENIVNHILPWLVEPERHAEIVDILKKLPQFLGGGGAVERACECILQYPETR